MPPAIGRGFITSQRRDRGADTADYADCAGLKWWGETLSSRILFIPSSRPCLCVFAKSFRLSCETWESRLSRNRGIWNIKCTCLMKCSNHNQTDAVATCVFCGRALCPSCVTQSATGRIVCSPACSSMLAVTEAELKNVNEKINEGTKRIIYFAFGFGLIFAGTGMYEFIEARSSGAWFLTIFSGGMGLMMIIYSISAALMLRKKR